jgi:hypothetical protein
LHVVTDVAEEVEYLDDIIACTDMVQTTTVVTNDSDVVWTFSVTNGAPVNTLFDSAKATSFKEVAKTVYDYAVLAPGTTMEVEAPPSDVTWELAPGLSSMWVIHDMAVERFKGAAQTAVLDVTLGRSTHRRAVGICALAAYNIAGTTGEGLDPDQPEQTLIGGLGLVSSAGSCASAWVEADRVAAANGELAPTWSDDIARWADDIDVVSRMHVRLSLLQRLGKIAAYIR